MIQNIFLSLILLFLCLPVRAGLLINEFTTGADGDWVELVYRSDAPAQMDISGLYVTMYYGSNEPLAEEPVTISSDDRDETPWDDRFIVVHVTGIEPDETDRTGDTNGNGYLDLYCGNYSNTFWNTEGVAAIDTDDDPANGGIIDFAAYSNRDGSPNSTMAGYIEKAGAAGQWHIVEEGIQQSCIDIGTSGLESFMSIARSSSDDTGSADDFTVTHFQTPGRENVLKKPEGLKALIKLETKRLYCRKKDHGSLVLPVFCREECSIRLRLFSPVGMMLHRSDLYRDLPPGRREIMIDASVLRKLPHGLIIGKIEALARGGGISAERVFYIVVMR